MLPIDRTSIGPQITAYSLPATHFIIISRGIALKGVTISALWPETAALVMMGLVAVVVSATLFSKKVR
jgi:hypothetical protein